MLEKILGKILVAGTAIAVTANTALADLTSLYNQLVSKGINATKNETINVNGAQVKADIFADSWDNPNLKYDIVVIDKILNQTEKDSVEAYGGYYRVFNGATGEADAIYNEITNSTNIVDNLRFKTDNKHRATVDIYNSLGKKVKSVKGLNSLDLPAGVYFYRTQDGYSGFKKLVVTK